jgi:hypothetical protein
VGYRILRTYAKRNNNVRMKKDLSKSNGKKVYYARLLPVSDKYRTYAMLRNLLGIGEM